MHTPGPWTIVEYGDGDSLAIHDGDSANRICFMATHGGSQKSWTAIQANAQAITATPDFMEAAAMMTAFACVRRDEETLSCSTASRHTSRRSDTTPLRGARATGAPQATAAIAGG